jgi:hypothetical protein
VRVSLRGVELGPDNRALGKYRLDLRHDEVAGIVLDREQAQQARRVVVDVIGQGAHEQRRVADAGGLDDGNALDQRVADGVRNAALEAVQPDLSGHRGIACGQSDVFFHPSAKQEPGRRGE